MSVQQAVWDTSELLEQNRQRLLKELRREIREYEARYELSSDRVEKELEAGRLRETGEICDWLIAAEMYRALQNESQT